MKYKYIGTKKQLLENGYHLSHVAVYPKKYVKIVDKDKKYIIEICMEEPSYNTWTNKDWKDSKILKLWKCKKLEYTNRTIVLEPNVKEHWYYEQYKTIIGTQINNYIQDLIEKRLIKELER